MGSTSGSIDREPPDRARGALLQRQAHQAARPRSGAPPAVGHPRRVDVRRDRSVQGPHDRRRDPPAGPVGSERRRARRADRCPRSRSWRVGGRRALLLGAPRLRPQARQPAEPDHPVRAVRRRRGAGDLPTPVRPDPANFDFQRGTNGIVFALLVAVCVLFFLYLRAADDRRHERAEHPAARRGARAGAVRLGPRQPTPGGPAARHDLPAFNEAENVPR